jgi:hypothetical protein
MSVPTSSFCPLSAIENVYRKIEYKNSLFWPFFPRDALVLIFYIGWNGTQNFLFFLFQNDFLQ